MYNKQHIVIMNLQRHLATVHINVYSLAHVSRYELTFKNRLIFYT